MELEKFLMVLLIVILVFAGFSGWYIQSTRDYGVTISEPFQGVYTNETLLGDYVEEVTGIGLNMTDEARTAKQIEGDYTDPTKALLKVPKMVWTAYDIAKTLIVETSALLHVPPILTTILFAVIIFFLVFGFIKLVFRFR